MAVRENVDLDRIVNYRAEYTAVIEKYQIAGDNLVGLCPFHRDKQSSFSVDLKTGQWHCFSEDEGGNFITFWAKYHGCDTKQAYKEILEKYGVAQEKPKPKQTGGDGPSLAPYSVEQYSFDKRLPVDFLIETCRVTTKKERAGLPCLQMPYFTEDGQQAAVRKRYGKKEFRWQRGSAGKICLYGGSRRSARWAGPFWWRVRATPRAFGTWASPPSVWPGPPCSNPTRRQPSKD